jgi:hypothetical protein
MQDAIIMNRPMTRILFSIFYFVVVVSLTQAVVRREEDKSLSAVAIECVVGAKNVMVWG